MAYFILLFICVNIQQCPQTSENILRNTQKHIRIAHTMYVLYKMSPFATRKQVWLVLTILCCILLSTVSELESEAAANNQPSRVRRDDRRGERRDLKGREPEGRGRDWNRPALDPEEQERRERLRTSDRHKSAAALGDRFATEKNSNQDERNRQRRSVLA